MSTEKKALNDSFFEKKRVNLSLKVFLRCALSKNKYFQILKIFILN